MDAHAQDHHHRVVASFDSAEQAREAMIALEQAGIEARQIDLTDGHVTTATRGRTRAQDREVFAEGAKRYVGTGIIGAVVGAAIAVGVVLALGIGSPLVSGLAAGIGGALFGFWAAAYYGVATRLPVNEEVFDTFGPGEETTPAQVVVDLTDPDRADEVVDLVHQHGAADVERARPS
jgi:hypothetical protein